jgi:hypothetical protein
MTNVSWERWARASGIGFVVMFIVSFVVYGDAPKVNDSATQIASFFDGDRSRVLTAMILFGIAFILLVAFIGVIASTLREAGKGGWGAMTIAAGAGFIALQAITGAIAGALALNIAAAGDEGVLVSLNTLVSTVDVISAYFFATVIFAATIGLSRAGLMAAWYGWIGFLAGVLVLLHGTNWATSGFWSPNGGYLFVTVIAGLGWTLTTSVLLYNQAPATAGAPERAAVPTT